MRCKRNRPIHLLLLPTQQSKGLIDNLEEFALPVICEKNPAVLLAREINPSAIYIIGSSFFQDAGFAMKACEISKAGSNLFIIEEPRNVLPKIFGTHIQMIPMRSKALILEVIRAFEKVT